MICLHPAASKLSLSCYVNQWQSIYYSINRCIIFSIQKHQFIIFICITDIFLQKVNKRALVRIRVSTSYFFLTPKTQNIFHTLSFLSKQLATFDSFLKRSYYFFISLLNY